MSKTVFRCESPTSSKRWWMWPRSGLNGDRRLNTRRTMTQNESTIGTPSTSSATITLAVPRIDRTPSVYPRNITPELPWKITAGWKFQRRNPSRAPAGGGDPPGERADELFGEDLPGRGQPRDHAVGEHKPAPDERERGHDGPPAGTGQRPPIHAALIRVIEDPATTHEATDGGRGHEGDGGREQERNDDRRDGRPGRLDEAHPAARSSPGTGKRAAISATSAARRSRADGSSRRAMASVASRAMARISSGPRPRVVVAGVPN